MVLEGVHLVPGMLRSDTRTRVVVQCVVAIPDEQQHRSHFWMRDHSHRRASGRATSTSRACRDPARAGRTSLERASAATCPVIENTAVEQAIGADAWSSCSSEAVRAMAASGDGPRRATLRPALLPSTPGDRAGGAGAAPLARPGRPGRGRGGGRVGHAGGARRDADRGRRRHRGRDSEELAPGRLASAPAARPSTWPLDPLEGRGVVARGGNGAMSMIARRAGRDRCAAARHVHAPRWPSGRARGAAIDLLPADRREHRRRSPRASGAASATSRRSCSTGRATTT